MIQPNLHDSCWVDGFHYCVYVRPIALPEIIQFLEHGDPQTHGPRLHTSFYATDMIVPCLGSRRWIAEKNVASSVTENPWHEIHGLFQYLHNKSISPPRSASKASNIWDKYKKIFIGPAAQEQISSFPVIWFNSVKPTQPHRWIIHILLSLGEFDCETNLMGHGNLVDNFVRARLLQDDPIHHAEDISHLIQQYVVKQLVIMPGGVRLFDRYLHAASHTLQRSLLHGEIPLFEAPPSLFTHIISTNDQKCIQHIHQSRSSLISATYRDLMAASMMPLPESEETINNATTDDPLNWEPRPVQALHQSIESYKEQCALLQRAAKMLNIYQQCTDIQQQGLVIVGGPGTGKTTCLQAIVMDCLVRGLNVALATVMAERACQLGGIHLSKLCRIPVNNNANSVRLAELAITALLCSPRQLHYIRFIDILVLDELGQLSAELISTLDIIFRRVRESTAFFGGILVFATLDECQLRPVTGRPPLLSPHMITCFSFQALDHSVRAATDPNLRRIIVITRMRRSQLTEQIEAEFKKLIQQHCTFVPDWNDNRLKPEILRMFARNKAKQQAECRLLSQMKHKYEKIVLSSSCIDQESTVEGNWVSASRATSKLLSQHIKEPLEVCFYPKATYEITFNHDNHHSQSQLAVLAEMPTRDQISKFEPVKLYVAPAGMKAIPSGLHSKQDYLLRKFHLEYIGSAPERTKYLGNDIQAKRQQYGLRHRIAATIHGGMGQDLPAIITKVDGPDYMLFQREQVVVLLSRTHEASQITFVGIPADTADALWKALDDTSQFAEYMEHLINELLHRPSAQEHRGIDIPRFFPFRPIDYHLPTDNSGYAYILASLSPNANGQVTYIGQAKNLASRFEKHLRGVGAAPTRDPLLQPWVMLGFVCGFEGVETSAREYFEKLWQATRDNRNVLRATTPLDANQIVDLGEEIVRYRLFDTNFDLKSKHLRFVRCGRIIPRR
jgi:predicted GIY-YIG superfamily endonuclease